MTTVYVVTREGEHFWHVFGVFKSQQAAEAKCLSEGLLTPLKYYGTTEDGQNIRVYLGRPNTAIRSFEVQS